MTSTNAMSFVLFCCCCCNTVSLNVCIGCSKSRSEMHVKLSIWTLNVWPEIQLSRQPCTYRSTKEVTQLLLKIYVWKEFIWFFERFRSISININCQQENQAKLTCLQGFFIWNNFAVVAIVIWIRLEINQNSINYIHEMLFQSTNKNKVTSNETFEVKNRNAMVN